MRDLFVQKYFSIRLCFIGERKLILFLLFSTRCGSPSPCKPSPPHQKANSSTVKWEWDTGVHSDANQKAPAPKDSTTGPPHSKSLLDGTVHTTTRTVTCPTGTAQKRLDHGD